MTAGITIDPSKVTKLFLVALCNLEELGPMAQSKYSSVIVDMGQRVCSVGLMV